MKGNLLALTFSLLGLFALQGQNQINLSIQHLLDGNALSFSNSAANNLGTNFSLDRLQYYISGVTLTHDGGTETQIPDFYALITTGEGESTSIDLGMQDISILEKLVFHIGVDEPTNHLDPAIYDADHPLAPKNPSMHWGWAGGYRFIALEGKSGDNLSDDLQLHCIGDNNYVPVEINMIKSAESGVLDIVINAEYKNAIQDINIAGGLIRHGDLLEIVDLVENFRINVFSDPEAPVNVFNIDQISNLSIYPNPSNVGNISLNLDLNIENAYARVTDLQGKTISTQSVINGENMLNIEYSGSYIVTILNEKNQSIASKQLIVH